MEEKTYRKQRTTELINDIKRLIKDIQTDLDEIKKVSKGKSVKKGSGEEIDKITVEYEVKDYGGGCESCPRDMSKPCNCLANISTKDLVKGTGKKNNKKGKMAPGIVEFREFVKDINTWPVMKNFKGTGKRKGQSQLYKLKSDMINDGFNMDDVSKILSDIDRSFGNGPVRLDELVRVVDKNRGEINWVRPQ